MIDDRACTIKLLEESLIPYSSKLVTLALSITYLLVCFQELLSTYAPICLIGRMGVSLVLKEFKGSSLMEGFSREYYRKGRLCTVDLPSKIALFA